MNNKTTLIFLSLLIVPLPALAADNSKNKTTPYQEALTKNTIKTHGDKYKPSKKINNLYPLPPYQKPSLNGNFDQQQRYQAANKTIKLNKKSITLDSQSPLN